MHAYDLPALFTSRAILEGLDPSGPPRLEVLGPTGRCRSVAVLPGAFNPPTGAHMLLAERALREGFDCVLLVLSRATVGKEQTGLTGEDRLLALRMSARAPGLVTAACSAGLYCDQAEAVARAYPGADVAFLVGSDKVVQIFEDRWYEDRDESLGRFFRAARLLVSPRADQADRVGATLGERRNAPYASSVSLLPLHPAVGDLSSTRVRGLLLSGADASGLVPGPVGEMLSQTRAFASPLDIDGDEVDAYRVRVQLIEALWRVRDWAEDAADLRALCSVALSATAAGRRLRTALGDSHPLPVEALAEAQAAAAHYSP